MIICLNDMKQQLQMWVISEHPFIDSKLSRKFSQVHKSVRFNH